MPLQCSPGASKPPHIVLGAELQGVSKVDVLGRTTVLQRGRWWNGCELLPSTSACLSPCSVLSGGSHSNIHSGTCRWCCVQSILGGAVPGDVVLFILAKPSNSKHQSPLKRRMGKRWDLCLGCSGAEPLSLASFTSSEDAAGVWRQCREQVLGSGASPGPGAREERGVKGCETPSAKHVNFSCDPEASLIPAWGCPGAAESGKARKQPPSHLLRSGECARGEAETRIHF